MYTRIGYVFLVASLFFMIGYSRTEGKPGASNTNEKSPLDYTMETIDGDSVSLDQYKGKVIMMINVASKCGNTPQYEQLEAIYNKYKDQGFTILGFPANNFAHQEPGSNAEIKQFCTLNYGVTFPMFAKISVKGSDKHPLYQYLTGESTDPEHAGDITWNFEKFLISRDGQVIDRFTPKTKPDDPKVLAAIEKALHG